MPTPLLIGLPDGLNVSGVTLWALRLAGALAARGHATGLVLHSEPADQGRLDAPIPAGVRVFDARGLADLRRASGALGAYVPVYREAVRELAAAAAAGGAGGGSGGPVVIAPTLLGDCFGIAAVLTQAEPERVRVVGWQHSDIEYDYRVLAHYEPMIARFAGVSDVIVGQLRSRLASRGPDISSVVYGVPVPAEAPVKSPRGGRPLRLIYTGRMEHQQKRVLALFYLSAELDARGVEHELVLLGDGPAAGELDALITGHGKIRRYPPAGPEEVNAFLERADVFVLASRYEGLSVAMLEAMARGVTPIVTRTESGAGQVIEQGVSGLVAQCGYDADEREAARTLADAVLAYTKLDAAAMSRAAWSVVRERFSLDAHAQSAAAVIESAAASRARSWPTDRPCAFSSGGASGGGGAVSGSVPPGGAQKFAQLLARLAGRRIVIHGTGRHTLELAGVLAESAATIAAFADDDRGRHGKTLWNWPVIAPADAARTGASDVVISSWMHEEAIYQRRQVYERQGLCVHRVYAGEG